MDTRKVIIGFVAATLVVAAGVYFFIASTTPLSTMQAVGVGSAFFLGWVGLAYAGSTALQGVLARSSAARRLAELRAATFSRLFLTEQRGRDGRS
jgi:hypothetical protein